MSANQAPGAFTALVYGFKLLTRPGIRQFVILPLLINVGIFAGLFFWGWGMVEAFQLQMEDWLPDALDFLSFIIWPIYVVASLFAMAYGFTTITNIIAAPFNALLSEKVEAVLGVPSAKAPEGISGFISSIIPTIGRELRKLLSNLKWMLLLFILLFIPGINILSIIIGAWMMAVEYLDYPADNHQLGFKEFLQTIKQKRFSAFSFGLTIMLASMIPFVNFLIVPASICASTALWHRDFHQQAIRNKKADNRR